MPSSADERDALMQRPSTPPQKNRLLFERKISEKPKEKPTANRPSSTLKTTLESPTVIMRLRVAMSEFVYRAEDNIKRLWWEVPQIVVVCGLILFTLYGMSVSSLHWFGKLGAIASRWEQLVETSGFVGWPRLEDNTLLSSICVASPVFVSVASTFALPWSLFTRHARGMKLFVCTLTLTGALTFVGLALSDRLAPIDGDTILSLSSQRLAVANFNREFCHAWCRESEFGLAALVRGECGLKQRTPFDEILAGFDVKNWCTEAIAQQTYELTAPFTGLSPFAGLKGPAGEALTSMRPDRSVLVVFSWTLFFISSLLTLLGATDLRW